MSKAVRLPLSFSSIENGIEFENLCADLLESEGFQIKKGSSVGPDGGCDLIVLENRESLTGYTENIRWLVQCKHRGNPYNTIGPREIGNIANIVAEHNADGYFLITDAHLTIGTINQLNAVARSSITRINVAYWDYRILCNHLLTHRYIIEKYLPNLLEPERSELSVLNPFIGLNSYEREHFHLFFGRDVEVHQLLEEIYRANQILLFGPSGCGKTSLINAGVSHTLEIEGVFVLTVRLLDSPVSRFVESIWKHGNNIDIWGETESMEVQDSESLCHSFCTRLEKREEKCLLILDQFEELFLYSNNTQQDEIAKLIEILTGGIGNKGWPKVLISIREDFIGEFRNWTMRNKFLKYWYNSIRLAPPDYEQVYEIITRACESVGAICEQNLIEKIINDLMEISSGPVYLPGFQIVSNELFNYVYSKTSREGNDIKVRLELNHYQTLGSAVGIIERFYDSKLWQSIREKERVPAAKLLMTLTSSKGTRLFRTWDEICNEVGEDPEILEKIRETLVNMRIIKTVASGEVDGYELTHDCLARRISEGMDSKIRDIKMFRELMKTCIDEWRLYQITAGRDRLEVFIRHLNELPLDEEVIKMILASFLCIGWFDNPWLITLPMKDILSASINLLREGNDKIKLAILENIPEILSQHSSDLKLIDPEIKKEFSKTLLSYINEESHEKLLDNATQFLFKLGYRSETLQHILQLPLNDFSDINKWRARVKLLKYFIIEERNIVTGQAINFLRANQIKKNE
jgi:hypothetical protein